MHPDVLNFDSLEALSKSLACSRDLPEALHLFAQAVALQLGARSVSVRVAATPEATSEIDPLPALTCGDYPVSPLPPAPCPTDELVVLGRRTTLHELLRLKSRTLLGPHASADCTLDADECMLLFTVECNQAIGWITVTGPKHLSQLDRRSALSNIFDFILPCLTAKHHLALHASADARRWHFYDHLLNHLPPNPDAALTLLCSAWHEVSGAEWVWFWLYNDLTRQWELVAVFPDARTDLLPKSLSANAAHSVAAYVTQTGNPEHVDDIHAWSRQLDGKEYRVLAAQHLDALGCTSFDSVPITWPDVHPGAAREAMPRLHAVLCMHYSRNQPRAAQPEGALRLMARLSSLALLNAHHSHQRSILLELNHLASTHLTSQVRVPTRMRAAYLDELIALIQRYLSVQFVSVFYRHSEYVPAQCIASTGLFGQNGLRISADSISNAAYSEAQGLTGRCLATGKPYISVIDDPGLDEHKPTFRDSNPAEFDQKKVAWIIYPLLATRDAALAQQWVAGVIRGTVNKAPLLADRPRNFDALQVQTLAFIAQQVAPVLATMASAIERERTVSIVKHDLFNPCRMLSDLIEAMRLGQGAPPGSATLANLDMAVAVIKNLIYQLDLDPLAQDYYAPQPLDLGQLLARLKVMLGQFALVENGMRIRFGDFRGMIPELYLDPNLMERTLCNLIGNAVKYGERGSTIDVDPDKDSDFFILRVKNEGIGVNPEDSARIFLGRYRAPEAVKLKLGHGLGLKIARAAIERHGGQLVLGRRAHPTEFIIRLPKYLAHRPRP